MDEKITENAIKQAYSVTIMQLFNVYLNSANDPNASARFQEGLRLTIQVRDACMQIASQNHAHEFISGYSQTAITMGLPMVMAIKNRPKAACYQLLNNFSILDGIGTPGSAFSLLSLMIIACFSASLAAW
ncbi:hypothetical protein M4W13_07425 [Citrobacter cronae]|uniref:hypothetical protein n=1 Tax=Citrobacter cronae TaxID=1748967 RepID=UPI002078EF9D|nr:hypothetical protein [Citrobacter cronae]MCM8841867.1 hypothetical protein [Citrobacter cronae]